MIYNDKLDANTQVTTEERIASRLQLMTEVLLRQPKHKEEVCQQESRILLRDILATFRPDLFEDYVEPIRHVVMAGNPIDGMTCYGPFDDGEAATEWADHNSVADLSDESWWVVGLERTTEEGS
jgi:hypothetical protein